MNEAVATAVDAIRNEIHRQVKDMSRADYREVYEIVASDMKSNLECMDEEDEEPDEWDDR